MPNSRSSRTTSAGGFADSPSLHRSRRRRSTRGWGRPPHRRTRCTFRGDRSRHRTGGRPADPDAHRPRPPEHRDRQHLPGPRDGGRPRRYRSDVSLRRLGPSGPRLSALRMEVRCAERPLAPGRGALRLHLGRPLPPGRHRPRPHARHRLVHDDRRGVAGAEGGLRAVARAGKLLCPRTTEDPAERAHGRRARRLGHAFPRQGFGAANPASNHARAAGRGGGAHEAASPHPAPPPAGRSRPARASSRPTAARRPARRRSRHVPTFARTSARRNLSMTSMKATEGTRRIRAVIEAIW